MKRILNNANQCRAGFSMIEIALALMVTAIGLMSIMAVMPASLDMNKNAIDDTQLSVFAESVLNGLRAEVRESTSISDAMNINELVPISASIWQGGAQLGIKINEPGVEAIEYRIPGSSVVDMALMYRVRMDQEGSSLIRCSVQVWAGVDLAAARPERARTFVTEFYNPDLGW